MKLTASERELCNDIEFDQEVFALVKQSCPGGALRQLKVLGANQEELVPGPGLSVRARKEELAEEWVEELSEVLPDGYLALASEDSDDDQTEVAVLKTEDPYDLLTLKGTRGEASGLSTAEIVTRLKDWDARFGLTVLGAAWDWVEFVLEALPSDLEPLVDEFIQLCPDLLSEGFDDLPEIMAEYKAGKLPEEFAVFKDIDWSLPGAGKRAFIASLQDNGSIYLWWD